MHLECRQTVIKRMWVGCNHEWAEWTTPAAAASLDGATPEAHDGGSAATTADKATSDTATSVWPVDLAPLRGLVQATLSAGCGVVESLVAATKLLKLAALHVVSHAHGVRAVPHRMDRISLCVLYGYHALCSTNVRSFNLVGMSANAH